MFEECWLKLDILREGNADVRQYSRRIGNIAAFHTLRVAEMKGSPEEITRYAERRIDMKIVEDIGLDRVLQELSRIAEKRQEKLMTDAAFLRAQGDALRSVLAELLEIVDNSNGVTGWHLNGDIAEWGNFPCVEEARELLKAGENGKA